MTTRSRCRFYEAAAEVGLRLLRRAEAPVTDSWRRLRGFVNSRGFRGPDLDALTRRPERWRSKTQRAASQLKRPRTAAQEISSGGSGRAQKTEVLSIC